MPVYEYQCLKCKNEFEIVQKITDEPLSRCSTCGGELKKLITSTSFVLKGSGWYVTDYPSADRKKELDSKQPVSADKDKKGQDRSKADTASSPQKAVNASS